MEHVLDVLTQLNPLSDRNRRKSENNAVQMSNFNGKGSVIAGKMITEGKIVRDASLTWDYIDLQVQYCTVTYCTVL
jgi:hypothetical protein